MTMDTLQAIRYSRGQLEVLDQLRLPVEFHYDKISGREEAFQCIKSMRVRGAPAIAIVASLALAVELHHGCCKAITAQDAIEYIDSALDYLKGSRPTAVDLTNAINHLKGTIQAASSHDPSKVIESYVQTAEALLRLDLETNLLIGQLGADWLREQSPGQATISVLTHCNTGSLATSGHGTALGIIRSLYSKSYLRHAYCTETRPYNQGSRLTAFELVYEKIPSTLITDSMAAALFATKKVEMNITAVLVGADRVVRNGDTANKIGTYALAVLARFHKIRFVVAAPTTSIDLGTETGAGIVIEERKKEELTQITGAVVNENGTVDGGRKTRVATADQRIEVWNPAFDVTPHHLIDAIVTEKGVVVKNAAGVFDFEYIMPDRWAKDVGSKQ